MHAQETKCMTEIAVMNGEFTNCIMYRKEAKQHLSDLLICDTLNLNPHARTLGTTINETMQAIGY